MDYPLMLYLGSLEKYAIAQDEDEKSELMKKGYTTHDKIMELEQKESDNHELDELDRDDIIAQLEERGEDVDRRSSTKTLANKLAKLKDGNHSN